jgi:hypothetical protein
MPPALTDNGRGTIPDLKRELFVLYSLGETISIVNPRYAGAGAVSGYLDEDEYTDHGTAPDLVITPHYTGDTGNGLFPAGRWPNQILIDGDTLFIVVSGENRIAVLSESSLEDQGSIRLPRGSNPYSLAADPANPGLLWVSGFSDNKVYALDTVLRQVAAVVDLNGAGIPGSTVTGPEGLLWQNGKLYVACSGWDQALFGYGPGIVAVIGESGGTYSVTGKITVGSNPQSLVPFADYGEIHVVCSGIQSADDGSLYVIGTTPGDPEEDTVTGSLLIGGSPVYNPGGNDPGTGTVYLSGSGGIRIYRRLPGGISVIRGSGAAAPLATDEAGGAGAWYSSVVADTDNGKLFAADFGHDALDVFGTGDGTGSVTPFLERMPLLDGPLGLTLGAE